MKRRDFLAASAGLAGAAIPAWARAEAAPCPPPSLSVSGGQSVTAECVAADTGGGPLWFQNQKAGTWQAIAGPSTPVGTGGTLLAVQPTGSAAVSNPGNGFSSLTTAWTGACVDQARKEYMMVANGGHYDYSGNEAYALKLDIAQPKWVRLNDPTPAVDFEPVPKVAPALYSDGRSKAMHTAGYQNCVDGRVWFAMQNSATSLAGGTSFAIVSFNRNLFPDAIPVSQGGRAPVPYAGSPNPWSTGYGAIGGLTGGETEGKHFGQSVVDELTGEIWATPTSSTTPEYFRIRTRSFSTQAFRQGAGWSGYPTAFVTCASDLRLLIVGIWAQNVIYVKRLDDDAQQFTQVKLPDDGFNWDPNGVWGWSGYGPNTPPGANKMFAHMSSNYHAASRSILIVNPRSIGSKIRRLVIPTSGGSYNPSGAWAWSTLDPAVSGATFSSGVSQGTYNKCRMVNDLGGASALVYCDNTNGPTFVYKV